MPRQQTDDYLDARAAPFKGRVSDDLLDEIRAAIDGGYTDGFADGHREGYVGAFLESGLAETEEEVDYKPDAGSRKEGTP